MEHNNENTIVKKKYRHDLGFIREMRNSTDGWYVIMLQDDIDHPFLNPETLTGKLLWFTRESGYDYCHPESRARERAEKIVTAYNEYDQLKEENQKLREALRETSPIIDRLINRTPSGKQRNELCDINIKVKTALENIKA